MALRWLITETLTGRIVQEVTVVGPSLTIDFARSHGTATLLTHHMIRADESLDLVRARQLTMFIEPAGAFSLACVDAEDDVAWGGRLDRVVGEWVIRAAAPSTGVPGIPVELGGLLTSASDRLLERDYVERGRPSWIAHDLLSQALHEFQVTIPKPTMGTDLPVEWRAGRLSYGQALADVVAASGLEVAVRHGLVQDVADASRAIPSRITREIVFGLPVARMNTGRVIEVADGPGGNGIRVSRPTSIDLWANSCNVYGAGSGDDQITGNAFQTRPARMPTVTRSFSHPDVLSPGLAGAMAAQHLVEHSGVGPLQVECLRANWTNKFPLLGDVHRVVVDPCLAFPWGIDQHYRVTRIEWSPEAADVLRLTMEESPREQ